MPLDTLDETRRSERDFYLQNVVNFTPKSLKPKKNNVCGESCRFSRQDEDFVIVSEAPRSKVFFI